MNGLTLNSIPMGAMGSTSIVSPIKKRKMKIDMAAKSAMGKKPGMSTPGISSPQLPFGGALAKR